MCTRIAGAERKGDSESLRTEFERTARNNARDPGMAIILPKSEVLAETPLCPKATCVRWNSRCFEYLAEGFDAVLAGKAAAARTYCMHSRTRSEPLCKPAVMLAWASTVVSRN
jgi:hypothetical protein